MFSKLILGSLSIYSLIISFLVHAQTFHGGAIITDTETLKDAVSQWGTTAAGIAVIVSGSLAVSSLILPWKFFKDTLGRASWIGLFSALTLFIVMSFFGNSIHQYMTSMYQCGLAIIGFPCN